MDLLTQGEVADSFGVSRTTIYQWQRQGLPYREDPSGVNLYHPGAVIHWRAGRDLADKRDLELQPLDTYLVGYLAALDAMPWKAWLERAQATAREAFNASQREFEAALVRVIRLGWWRA